MKRKIFLVASSLIIFGFSGCAPKMERASTFEEKLSKEFKTNPNKSNIYICRNEAFGAAINMPIMVDGNFIGKSEGSSHFYLTVEPGIHKIQSLTENVQTIFVPTEKNKNYFVWQEVKMGLWAADSSLHSVNENDNYGEKCILETPMLKANH